MGFREFQRLQRHISSRLLGLDFSQDEASAATAHDAGPRDGASQDGDASGAREQERRRASERARERWQDSVRKVVLLNRFLAAVKASETKYSWLDAYFRQTCYNVSTRIFNCPFEAMYVRASLGMVKMPSSDPVRVLGLDGAMGVLALDSLLGTTIDAAPVPKSGWGWRTCRVGLKAVVGFPLESAFVRKVLLGTPVLPALRGLSWASYNGFGAFVAQEVLESTLGGLYKRLLVWSGSKTTSSAVVDADADEDDDDEGILTWLSYMTLRFLASVPLVTIRNRIFLSNPEGLFPAPLSVAEGAALVVNDKGWSGLYTGLGGMMMLLPPIFGVFVTSQLLVHACLGSTRKEIFEQQVAQVRDLLVLKKTTPLLIDNRDHLETVVEMASTYHRVLVLLLVNSSKESEHARRSAAVYAKQIDATFIIGDTVRLPFLHKLVRDARLPFLMPITNGSIDLREVILYSHLEHHVVLQKLKVVVQLEHMRLPPKA